MSEGQLRDAALRALLVDADLLHWDADELAEEVTTERGYVQPSVWVQALKLVSQYEPLRPLYKRRDLATRGKQTGSCLHAPEFGLWQLRYDLLMMTPGDEMTVGASSVRRVWCRYGARWVIRRGHHNRFSGEMNEFDALMRLKDDYMNDGVGQVSDKPVIVSAALLRGARLSPDALAVYVNLIGFALDEGRDGRPPTNDEIAAAVQVSEKRVITAVKELEAKRVIAVEREKGGVNLYTFLEWLGTTADGSTSVSYISKDTDSFPKSKKRISTTAKNDTTPVENAAINLMLEAWVKSSGSADNPYNRKAYRLMALNLHRAGVTPDDVLRYVTSLQTDPFWKKTGVSWAQVVKGVRAWAGKLDKPAAQVQVIDDPFAGQAPRVIGK